MTETRLRSFTHLAGYAFASLFIASLAFQNLRYGFYDLFFLAAGMALLTVAGAGYTFICRRRQLSAPGHLIILTGLNSGLVAAMFALGRSRHQPLGYAPGCPESADPSAATGR